MRIIESFFTGTADTANISNSRVLEETVQAAKSLPVFQIGSQRWDLMANTARQYRESNLSGVVRQVKSREWLKVPRDHHTTRNGNKRP